MIPHPAYTHTLEQLADGLLRRADPTLTLVAIDGLPASGKSSLARNLRDLLLQRGRPCAIVENDWFIDRAIRSPLAIAHGFAIAVAPLGPDRVERLLLQRFLDARRLDAFLRDLTTAHATLQRGLPATLHPQGALWNLRRPPAWSDLPAAHGLTLQPGAVLLIEGTLTRATYLHRLPHLLTLLVRAPVPTARQRFLHRNRDPRHQRNLAFTALAFNALAFRLAAGLLERHRDAYHAQLLLDRFDDPTLTWQDEGAPGGA